MGLMNVLSANKECRISKRAHIALFFSQSTAVLQMLLEIIMTTGCLRIHIKSVLNVCLNTTKAKRYGPK